MRLHLLMPFLIFFSFILMLFTSLVLIIYPDEAVLGLKMQDLVNLQIGYFFTLTFSVIVLLAVYKRGIIAYLNTLNMDLNLFLMRLGTGFVVTVLLFVLFLPSSPEEEYSKIIKEQIQEKNIEKSIEPAKTKNDTLDLKTLSENEGFKLKNAISLLKIKGLHEVDETVDANETAKSLGVSLREMIEMFKTHEKIISN